MKHRIFTVFQQKSYRVNPSLRQRCASRPCSTRRLASEDHPSSNYELNHDRRSRHFSGEQLAHGNVDFRLVRNPTRIDGKCGDHFLQADLSLLIGPTWITSGLHDNSEVILLLRTEGVVIMLWSITDHSSAARVPDNDHPGP
jgi:hypothetical protein